MRKDFNLINLGTAFSHPRPTGHCCDVFTVCFKKVSAYPRHFFDKLARTQNARWATLFSFLQSDFQLPRPLKLEGLKTAMKIQRRGRSARTVVRSPSHCKRSLVVRFSIVSKDVADKESLSELSFLQAQSFRSFFCPVAVTTKFSSAGALVFCSCAPVVAKRKTRHLLRKFLFGLVTATLKC
jgi:hypothetical protein